MLESLWAAVDRVWLVSCKTLTVSLVDEMGTRLVVASVYCPTECNAGTAGKYRFFHVAVEESKSCSRVAHSSVVSVVCGDFNGELAAYHPSEMAAAGLGHVAAGVIDRSGMATAEPNCNRRRLPEEAAAAGRCDASSFVRKPYRRRWTFRGNFGGDQEQQKRYYDRVLIAKSTKGRIKDCRTHRGVLKDSSCASGDPAESGTVPMQAATRPSAHHSCTPLRRDRIRGLESTSSSSGRDRC